MNQMTLKSAIMQFAFSGVFAPHRAAPDPPPPAATPRAAKK